MSVDVPIGSRLYLIEPTKVNEVYGIIAMLLLNNLSPIFFISTPSIKIEPFLGSVILKRTYINEDFPAPVLPTQPIF